MGREIRKVPPKWEHPRYTKEDAPNERRIGDYRPLFDQSFADATKEWLETFDRIRAGNLNGDFEKKYYGGGETGLGKWVASNGLCEPDTYVPYEASECSWFQVYETVSEGTPVTPPFATKEELINYLTKHGTFWDTTPIDRAVATKFVDAEWAPSMVITVSPDGKREIKSGIGAVD